ncbi:MAG: cadherin domain-containing protein [Anaerolineales bacterium]
MKTANLFLRFAFLSLFANWLTGLPSNADFLPRINYTPLYAPLAAPADINLTSTDVDENLPTGTTVGTFSSVGGTGPFTYALVSGAGDTDNGSFNISGDTLTTAAAFDYEAQSSYSILVRSTDTFDDSHLDKNFIISVNDLNENPTDISLSATTIAENQSSGTTVGTFSTSDPDSGDTFTYSFATGPGDDDNGSFTITGNSLKTAGVFDFETKPSYSILIRSTDSGSLFTEKAFTITINNANDPPTDISLSSSTVNENLPSGTVVGSFTTSDQDSGQTFTYSLVPGIGSSGNSSFNIVGNSLNTAAIFDYEAQNSYSIRVRSTDSGTPAYYTDKIFTITINNTNDPPTDISLSSSIVDENLPIGTLVGSFSTTDPNVGDSFTYSLVSGPGSTDNGSFTISGNSLNTAAIFDYETKASYFIRVRSTDSGAPAYYTEKAFIITINDTNDPPTGISLSSSTVDENLPIGTVVGSFSTTDPDAGDTFSYSLVPGLGSDDNASFTITGNSLKTAEIFNYEARSIYSIRVRSTDSGISPLSFDKIFIITINDLNETPTDILLSSNNVDENKITGTVVGSFSTLDPDTGDTFTYALVSGLGSDDNSSFTITGNNLKTAAVFDFETKNSYSIRVRSTDSGVPFRSFEKAFLITVNDLNEAPSNILLSGAVINENSPTGTTIGGFSTTDPDIGETFAYTLTSGTGDTGNASFTIAGNLLKSAASFNFEDQGSYSIRVRSTDSGGLFTEKAFTIVINDVNEAPVALDDPYSVMLNNTLTITGTGVLSNDADEDGNPLTAILDHGPLHAATFTFNSDGSFTYQPQADYVGTDSFTYHASDGLLDSEIATAEIGVFDATKPQLHWTWPVSDGETYPSWYTKVRLCVEAQDDLAIDHVEFYRWDAANLVYVTIAILYKPPYCIDLDTRDLNPDWNQIFAIAYDDSGNKSPRQWIWITLDPIYPIYLPSIWQQGGS